MPTSSPSWSTRPARGCRSTSGRGWPSRARPAGTWAAGAPAATTGAFSWRNALVVDAGRGAIGCLIGYPLAPTPQPVPADTPPLFRPLEELEREAPGTWYINVIAVLPAERGRGHGARLIEAAREAAAEAGREGLSLIVADSNAGARRFYEREGFADGGRAAARLGGRAGAPGAGGC